MDELLSAVVQRKSKINEVLETILKLKVKNVISQSERSTIYAIIRKLKEEEKNRTEKENWIVSIMRNTKQYNEEQMNHIFVKTNDIMKLINESFIELPYQPPNSLVQFLEQYYNLHQGFFQQMNQEYQLKIQYKQAIKQGNINLITDLIKALLASSRKILKDNIDDLAYQVNKDLSPEKQKIMKKLIPDPLVEHLRTRSSTQNGKKDGTVISMTNSVIQNEEPIRYNDKREYQQIKEKLKQQQRRFILQPKIPNQEIMFLDSPVYQLKLKYQQYNNSNIEKNQFASLFNNINLDDLDDQNICVLDYQTIKRQQQNFEEFKLNFDSLYDKIKMRNSYIQQSVMDYNQYISKKCTNSTMMLSSQCNNNLENEFFNVIKDKYEELTSLNAEFQQNMCHYHFCRIYLKPHINSICACYNTNSSKYELNSNPIKNKIVIRKSVQSIKKSTPIQQNQNTFTSKNLIEQLKKERTFNQSIILEDSSYQDIYKYNNSSGISPLNNSILQIRKLDQSQNLNGSTQYKLYSHKLSSDIQSFKQTSLHHRAQSANGDQLIIPPLNLRNCAE
ncbi:unnamed protein product (macronuclear) [Paramecium tetraurelia]|uniref:Uncharacterized protein n=1 Tax=Paramecium tetraurelia TaxID=5888 RepID=A0BYA1_PARTE|nr:uncharacterized protein GSPATT00033371001 [Paramecium tetraurelia]CAK63518.1 unnamed protein product [Paramecium tetraurelia]|eukprot:XP_001430916.1 hypothetical protein (macronuclear) [Paramecium tetraurelia strain d4-2]